MDVAQKKTCLFCNYSIGNKVDDLEYMNFCFLDHKEIRGIKIEPSSEGIQVKEVG